VEAKKGSRLLDRKKSLLNSCFFGGWLLRVPSIREGKLRD